jgi:hypothetical protein
MPLSRIAFTTALALYHVHHKPLYHAIGEPEAGIDGRCRRGRRSSG